MKKLFENASTDIVSGLVVFLVALPLCLGVSIASDAPEISGIIAGVVGGILVGILSGSSLGVSGPTPGLAIIIAGGLATMTFPEFLSAGIVAGLIQLVMGVLRLGFITMYFPTAVIRGLLSGIGVLLILKQIPHAIGYDRDPEGDWSFHQADGMNTFEEIFYAFQHMNKAALIIGVVSLIILIMWELPLIKRNRILRKIPAALLVVILGLVINMSYKWVGLAGYEKNSQGEMVPNEWLLENRVEKVHRVKIIEGEVNLLVDPTSPNYIHRRGKVLVHDTVNVSNNHLVNIPNTSLADMLTFPKLEALGQKKVWILGILIAIAATLEALMCVEATDKLDPMKRITSSNRELIAQGFGNIFVSFIGGLPVTQVIVRSSANIGAGAKSKLSTIFHGLFLGSTVVFIPHILNMIPLSCLAAILLVVGYKLARYKIFLNMYRNGINSFLPFMVTIVSILLTDLIQGTAIGLVVGVVFVLLNNYKVSFFFRKIVAREDGSKEIVIELSENVTFLNKANIQNALKDLPHGSDVLIDGTDTINFDRDVLEIIHEFRINAKERNIKVELINIPEVDLSLGG